KNRCQVDYDARSAALAELGTLEEWLDDGEPVDPYDHRVKLLVIQRLLEARRGNPDLFWKGSYSDLVVRGARTPHLVAFLRTDYGRHAIVLASRLMRSFSTSNPGWWSDTTVELPRALSGRHWHS